MNAPYCSVACNDIDCRPVGQIVIIKSNLNPAAKKTFHPTILNHVTFLNWVQMSPNLINITSTHEKSFNQNRQGIFCPWANSENVTPSKNV